MFKYNICYSLDSKYVEQLSVSLCSILKNSNIDENINFYILDGGLSEKDKAGIEKLKRIKDFSVKYILMKQEDFKDCPLLTQKHSDFKNYHVTLPTYFRFKLPSLLKNTDKILYLDCDVIIKSSLKELFEINIKNNSVLMVLDAESRKEAARLGTKNYYNAGVMLINLEFCRKNNVESLLFDYAKNNSDKILWQDQDIINVVLQESIKKLDKKWNYQYFQYEEIDSKELDNSCVLHLAGRFKPWLMPFEHPLYDLYYYYLSFTDWRNKIVDYKKASFGKHLKDNIGGSITNILVNATDEDIKKIYDEIEKNYKYTAGLNDVTQNNINKVYDEITKNYDYTNKLSEDNKIELRQEINKTTEVVNSLTDEKISNVYNEITKNYDYTNKLAEDNKQEIKQKIKQEIESVNSSTDEKISKVYDEISKTEEEITDTVNNFKVSSENKFLEINSYIKEEIAQLYKDIAENHQTLNKRFDAKDYENYKKFEITNQQIYSLNDRLNNKADNEKLASLLKEIEAKLFELQDENKLTLDTIKNHFEEELNAQRIKYEKKLIQMEEKIASLDEKYQPKKMGFLEKIKNRIKNK